VKDLVADASSDRVALPGRERVEQREDRGLRVALVDAFEVLVVEQERLMHAESHSSERLDISLQDASPGRALSQISGSEPYTSGCMRLACDLLRNDRPRADP